jgi:hypothetical protein
VASRAIEITSKLALEQRSALERLLFFNQNQYRVRDGIEESIATYGVPEIYVHDQCLRISVGDVAGVQSLFAVTEAGQPLGLAVYVRTATERFVVLHLVVEVEPESCGGTISNAQVVVPRAVPAESIELSWSISVSAQSSYIPNSASKAMARALA